MVIRHIARATWLVVGCALLGGCAAMIEEAQRGAALPAAGGPVDLHPAWSLTGVRLTSATAGSGTSFPSAAGGFFTFMRPAAIAARETDVFVVDAGRNALLRIDPFTQTAAVLPVAHVALAGPVQLAVRPDRSLLLIDRARVVHWFAADGRRLPSLQAPTPDLGQPVDVVDDDAHGRVLVADALYRQVIEFTPAARAWRVVVPRDDTGAGLSSLAALTVDARGIYLADPVCRCIALLHPSGRVLGRFGNADLVQPAALAADGRGRLFVADAGVRQLRVFADGKPLQAFAYRSLGVGEITDMTIDSNTLYIAAGSDARVLALRIVTQLVRPQ